VLGRTGQLGPTGHLEMEDYEADCKLGAKTLADGNRSASPKQLWQPAWIGGERPSVHTSTSQRRISYFFAKAASSRRSRRGHVTVALGRIAAAMGYGCCRTGGTDDGTEPFNDATTVPLRMQWATAAILLRYTSSRALLGFSSLT
jgi:hypothetical protein